MYFTDGWITKMTAQGTTIWSKRYNMPRHNVVAFRDILPGLDSTYFVVGTVSYLWPIDTVLYSRDHWGILLHIDKQGQILSSTQLSARFEPLIQQTFLQSISKTRDDNFILTGVITDQTSYRSTQIIIKMNRRGKIKWTSTLFSYQFAFAVNLTKSLQLRNENIVVAGLIYQRGSGGFGVPKVGYYFLALDNTTGAPLWNHAYLFINKPSSKYFATTESLQHIEELPNGNLSFIAFTTDSSGLSNPPYTSKSLNIITNDVGQLQQVTAYENSQPGTYPVAVLSAGKGNQLVLNDDGENAPLIQIDNSGQIKWLKGYATGSTVAPVSLNAADSGYYIFLNDRGPYGGSSFLMKVDATASIDCKNAFAQLTAKDVTSLIVPEDAMLSIKASNEDTVLFSSLDVLTYDYPVGSNVKCIKACCKDVTDTVLNKTLCSGDTYTLPDKYIVRDSGTYYVPYKQAKGCDSIAYYHFNIVKNPGSLKLSGEICLEGISSTVLTANSGFDKYNWTNTITTDSTYIVTKPGVYWVEVSNNCGSKRDSIEVFDKCDIPVYIPNAFTPNGDGLNDVFNVPPQKQNKFISLTIYNHWGQKIFETKDESKGWDGRIINLLQPVGIYVYVVIVHGISGKTITKKGTVNLIR